MKVKFLDLNKHENTIKEIVDSFIKMCDYIEQGAEIGCAKCPIMKSCYYTDKHKGLFNLIQELEKKDDNYEG